VSPVSAEELVDLTAVRLEIESLALQRLPELGS
jgi:DNA-binding GntR family transcriptional regulator